MHHVQIGKKQLYVPSCWNELTARQLLLVVKLTHNQFKDKWQLRLSLLQALLGIRWSLLLYLDPVQQIELSHLTEWIFDSNTLTKNLIPTIRLPWYRGGHEFSGPADDFDTIRGHEFAMAEQHVIAFTETRDPELLDGLVAVLYRPKRKDLKPNNPRFDGDIREPYNLTFLNKRAALMQHVPVGSSRVDLQACKLEYSIVSPK